jgi:hypothetical protein
LNPKQFLVIGGAVLVLLGIAGMIGFGPTATKSILNDTFWLDNGENVAHLFLGVVALAAVFVPGINSVLEPYYRQIVILVGLVALFFGVYGFFAGTNVPNTFGLANLEFTDNILHLVVAVWAFAAAFMKPTSSANM